MDWFSWLSKTGLDPSLVYQYGVAFTHNELEQDDIPYFNHEFLQSMGISIAKHRLEILKLAKKEKILRSNYYSSNGIIVAPRSMSRVFVSIKRSTKRCLNQILKNLISREDGCYSNSCNSSALVVVQQPNTTGYYGSRWRGAMAMRRSNNSSSKRMLTNGDKQGRLLLTHGNTTPFSNSWGSNLRVHSFSSPMMAGCDQDQDQDRKPDHDQKGEKLMDGDDDGHWTASTGVEEIRWDTMFQNLKPT